MARESTLHSFDIAIHPEELKHCPRCAGDLVWREIAERVRPVCERCGFTFFFNLKVGAGVLVDVEGKVLLTRRAIEPGKGQWCLPAGFVEYDETPEEAARRECQEETGLAVELDGLFGVYHYRHDPRGRGILILYVAHTVGGELKAGDDADEVGLFAPDGLPPLAFRSHREALVEWRRRREMTDPDDRSIASHLPEEM